VTVPPSVQSVSPITATAPLAARVAAQPRDASTRSAAIDHLRIVLTGLVIFHHVAITYGGSGGWYYREQPNSSQPWLLIFNATDQAFFMGFFFLLSGYYTPASYERKGPRRFWAERLCRLGVPLLVYFFVLSPLTLALGRMSDGHAFWSGWWEMTRRAAFGPGPLWFAEALLLFGGGYALWRWWRPPAVAARELPGFATLGLAALLCAAGSFLVRLVVPVGREVAWLQLGYFPCYVFLFAAGCGAARARVLERITFRQACPWLLVALVAWATLPIAVFFGSSWQGAYEGGLNLNALSYALWDPLVGWGVILGLLWAARMYWSRGNRLTGWLAASAYAAYIVHPPVAVGLGIAAKGWPLNPLAKFAVMGAAACAGSFLLGAALRALPGARRIL
jgi:glucans biosynthesis protein C